MDLNEAIREIIVLAKSEMEKQQVTLRLELSPDVPNVLGDRVQLQQVMLNLILNAIDAMATVQDRARDLFIRTQSGEDGKVLTTVRDTGIGLDPGSIKHTSSRRSTPPSPEDSGWACRSATPLSRITPGDYGRRVMTVPGRAFASHFHRSRPKVNWMFSHERSAPLCDRDASMRMDVAM